jgi:hypothetical protein
METQRSGTIEYLSGGVGEIEREQFRAVGDRYNLKVTTTTDGGGYVSGVDLAIDDANGSRLLETRTNGPLFYAQVPEGRYTVRVRANGQSLERSVRVGTGAAPQLVFRIAAPAVAPSPYTGPSGDSVVRDEGLSLYSLDPGAGARARKQLNYYEVLPDGTTRPLGQAPPRAPASEY